MEKIDLSTSTDQTPLPVIANVSRIVTKVVDRISGDRNEVPLMVAAAVVEGLKSHGIESRVMYGPAAWIEVLENTGVVWAGCWGEFYHFWVATQFGEVVDLNTAVSYRKRSHQNPDWKPKFSAPLLWSREVPKFYRYQPEGIAELELTAEDDIKKYQLVVQEVLEKCRPELLKGDQEEFPNEAMLCPGRRVLDDSQKTFKQFDRIISVQGIPDSPI